MNMKDRMKCICLRLMLVSSLCLIAISLQAQEKEVVSLDYQKASLAKALDTLRTYTDMYNITFVHNDIEHLQVTLRAINLSIPDAVELICKGQPVKVKIKDHNIIVKYRPEKDRTIALWGHVRDSFTKHGVLNAKITMMTDDGMVLDTLRTWRPNNDRDDAVFRVEVPIVSRSYRFVAEHPDYETTSIDYTLRYAARNDYFDLPNMFMQKKTLQLNGGDLGEVVVKATKVQMVYRGDTIVYNADAFNVPEGSMLDALIKQMPGVELKPNGEIYVQGRKVDFLTLNGEDFFRGKNKVMLENLPYYTVKDIEVYEKQTEKSEWLGVAEAPKDYVMNVVLKREYRKGYLANIQGGLGTKKRYEGKAFGQRYTDHSNLNAFFNANNVNEMNNPGNNGEWSPDKVQRDGVINMKKAGVNLNINDKDKRWMESGNVEVAWTNQQKEEHTSIEHFLQKGNEFTREVNNLRRKSFQIAGSNTFTLRKPFWLRNRVGAFYNHNTDTGNLRYGRFGIDPSYIGSPIIVLDSAFKYSPELMNVLVNMRNDNSGMKKTNWFVEYLPNLSYKFLWGDDIDLWGKLHYEGDKRNHDNHVLTEGYSSDYRQKHLQYDSQFLNWEAGVQYTVHSHSHWNYRAAVGYYYKKDDVMNELFLSITPNSSQKGELDPRNTYDYLFTSKRVAPMAMIYYQRDNQKRQRSDWFSVSLPFQIERQYIDYRLSDGSTIKGERNHTEFSRNIALPTPEIRYESTFKKGMNYLYLTYKTQYFTPTMMYLLSTYWDEDPLNVQLGNENVKNHYRHQFVVNYKIGQKKHNQYLRFDGGLNIDQNKIVNGRTYDPKTGVTYYQFENVSGNWDCWGQLSFGRMLDANNHLWLEARTTGGYDHRVGISTVIGATDRKSIVGTWDFGQYALLRYRWGKLTTSGYVRYGTSWNRYSVSARGQLYSFHPTTIHYGLSGQYEIPILRGKDGRGLQIATDMVLYVKRGYGDSSMNTNDLVWNASIAKSLWKNKIVVKIEGFDMLNQLSNIYSTINAQGRVETWRNMIPSFVMLHLQWHFSHMPDKKR